jgi:haloalkane dehalogenase
MPTIDVLDPTISYQEAGSGTPVVFLHGNPAWSYVWRNVLPTVARAARSLAPDLIGMGRSGKPDITYTFDDHSRYLDAWFDGMGVDQVVLVGHDWGGALAFDWARRHPDRVRGVAFFETIVRPFTWEDFPGARPRYEVLRTPGSGEQKVLEDNFFIETALQATVLSGLAEEDRLVYAEPYPTPESRRAMLYWPRAMPIEGQPPDVVDRVERYDAWLAASADVPKLLLTFDGPEQTLMIGAALTDWCTTNIAALEVQRCGPAGHIAQEDQPAEIAAAIVAWLHRHDLVGRRSADDAGPVR